jgi:hypothetical protein
MSGGHFDYKQFEITRISDEIEQLIEINGKKRAGRLESWEEPHHYEYPPGVIKKFKEAVLSLRVAQAYAQRVDWLVSGDDGEESFMRRLDEDLKDIEKRYEKWSEEK